MESKEDIVRIKEEPKYPWPEAGDDYNFDSVHSCEVKDVKTFTFYKSSANYINEVVLPKKLDGNISIHFTSIAAAPPLYCLGNYPPLSSFSYFCALETLLLLSPHRVRVLVVVDDVVT
ncbi:hypothetical protein TKK_0015159 [Trichogramma kaykai]